MEDYSPLDLSSIKPAKLHSERELDSEINKIAETLKDNCKNYC